MCINVTIQKYIFLYFKIQFNTIQYNLMQKQNIINTLLSIVFIDIFTENKEFLLVLKLLISSPGDSTKKAL